MKSVRSVALIVGVAGALVVACAVVLQSQELSVPPVHNCQVPRVVRTLVSEGPALQTTTPLGGIEFVQPHPTVTVTQSPVPAKAATAAIARCLAEVSSRQSTALTYGWAAALAVLALGIAMAVASGASRRRARAYDVRSASPAPRSQGPVAAPRPSANGREAGACARERAILATACIEVSDLVDSAALREQLLDALKASGVSPVEAGVGEPFDSSRHKAVGTIPTTDRGNDNTVAETQRPGYADRGKRVRYPEVLVFKWSGVGE
jgi:molecular chaperone GrpE